MKKLIVCFGDSWTAGHFKDPNIKVFKHLLDENNKEYCISKTWVRHLEINSKIKTVNLGQPACSNDMVIKQINSQLLKNIKGYNPEEVLAIVGWTSPERKTFPIQYSGIKLDHNILPSEGLDQNTLKNYTNEYGEYDGEKLWEFYKSYCYYFWNPEEYMIRHRNNILLADNIFTSNNIDVLYFDAFYEVDWGFFSREERLRDLELTTEGPLGTLCKNIYNEKFLPLTFREYIEEKDKTLFEKDNQHPTEEGHKLWAKYLLKELNDRKKIS